MKIIIGVLSLCAFVAAQDNFKECLDKDSISCMQMMVRLDYLDFVNIEHHVADHDHDTWSNEQKQ